MIKRIVYWYSFVYLFFFNLSNASPLAYVPLLGEMFLAAYVQLKQSCIPVLGNWLGLEVLVQPTGSGDTMLDWLTLLAIACLAATLSPALAWLTRHKPVPVSALLLWVRICLGNTLIVYGAMKFIPTQMPSPSLHRLTQPLGEFSPMGLVWTFMGFSPIYQSITGLVELSAGLLLFHPRTRLLGAAIGLVACVQVFLMNMCFDVPVKIYSFHMVAMAVLLILPDTRRLLNLFLMNGTVEAGPEYYLSAKPRLEGGAQVLLGLAIGTVALMGAYQYSPIEVPHKGIWDLQGSPFGWTRLIIERPGKMTVVKDGKRESHEIHWTAQGLQVMPEGLLLPVDAPDPNTLNLGVARGKRYDNFLLMQRGFHWVQEVPFNR